MAKLLWFVALVVIVDAAHKHHPKFRKTAEEYESSVYKKGKLGKVFETFFHYIFNLIKLFYTKLNNDYNYTFK